MCVNSQPLHPGNGICSPQGRRQPHNHPPTFILLPIDGAPHEIKPGGSGCPGSERGPIQPIRGRVRGKGECGKEMSLREVWRPSKTAYDKTKHNKKAERLVTNLSSQRGEEIVVSSVGFGAGPAGKARRLFLEAQGAHLAPAGTPDLPALTWTPAQLSKIRGSADALSVFSSTRTEGRSQTGAGRREGNTSNRY